MHATSLKLPEDLKARAADAARRSGLSPHAFMVEAIERATTQAEQRASFVRDALEAQAELEARDEVFEAAEVHAWLQARLDGRQAPRPAARRWRG